MGANLATVNDMKTTKSGPRRNLLLYQRMMDRLWRVTLPLGLFVLAWWNWGGRVFFAPLEPPIDLITLCCGIALVCFSVFFIITRHMAYVQARQDHIRLVTPFIKLKISYQRVRSLHPVNFTQLFPPNQTSWSARRFLRPFYGKTALALELTALPFSKGFLRLFFAPQMFLPTTNGFVLLVDDWMDLSMDIDSRMGNWRQKQTPPKSNFSLKPLKNK
jgi:hypothetical protein